MSSSRFIARLYHPNLPKEDSFKAGEAFFGDDFIPGFGWRCQCKGCHQFSDEIKAKGNVYGCFNTEDKEDQKCYALTVNTGRICTNCACGKCTKDFKTESASIKNTNPNILQVRESLIRFDAAISLYKSSIPGDTAVYILANLKTNSPKTGPSSDWLKRSISEIEKPEEQQEKKPKNSSPTGPVSRSVIEQKQHLLFLGRTWTRITVIEFLNKYVHLHELTSKEKGKYDWIKKPGQISKVSGIALHIIKDSQPLKLRISQKRFVNDFQELLSVIIIDRPYALNILFDLLMIRIHYESELAFYRSKPISITVEQDNCLREVVSISVKKFNKVMNLIYSTPVYGPKLVIPSLIAEVKWLEGCRYSSTN